MSEVKPKEVENEFKGTTFVMRLAKGSLNIPARDDNGKKIQKANKNGNPIFTPAGEKVYIMGIIEFKTIIADVERGTYCQYTAKNAFEEKYLMEKRVDPSSGVITKADYKKLLNPEAAAANAELDKVKIAAREQVDKKDAEIAELKRKLDVKGK